MLNPGWPALLRQPDRPRGVALAVLAATIAGPGIAPPARGRPVIVGLSTDREPQPLAPAISHRRVAIGKTQLDRLERIAAAGPACQGIGHRAPARRETHPPLPAPGSTGLMDGERQWLDHGMGGGWKRVAGAGASLIVVGDQPGTEVPGHVVTPPCH